ncbi:hypothetical protein ACW0KB_03210 [Virgibacillus salarius]
MLIPKGYDLKALKPIGHLLAVDPTLTIIGFYYLMWRAYYQLYAGKI